MSLIHDSYLLILLIRYYFTSLPRLTASSYVIVTGFTSLFPISILVQIIILMNAQQALMIKNFYFFTYYFLLKQAIPGVWLSECES